MEDVKKIALGQFFTKETTWAQPQVNDFIEKCINNHGIKYCVDPFAGDGDLLSYVKNNFEISKVYGMDIDPSLKWPINDSLTDIKKYKDSIIVTNPPYLASYSARRKGEEVYKKVAKYFMNTACDDLYQVALEKMLNSYDYVVAIIPETFINSSFSKDRLDSVTILENIPFVDTDCPVCVCCFDNIVHEYSNIKFYKNEKFICTYADLLRYKKVPTNIINIKFNDKSGQIALRAVDNTVGDSDIKFLNVKDLDYDIKNICVSSRLITVIDIPNVSNVDDYVETCNEILKEYRNQVADILLSPFKGNKKNGVRRRRLDYKTARAILEEAYEKTQKA